MTKATTNVDSLAKPDLTSKKRKDRGDVELSSSMRELILSFGVGDSDPPWNADAYPRRTAA